jgi:hypothetical protein
VGTNGALRDVLGPAELRRVSADPSLAPFTRQCLRLPPFSSPFQPLCRQLSRQKIDAGHVSARPGQAGDKTKPDRVIEDDEHDGIVVVAALAANAEGTSGGDYGHPPANQISRQLRQSSIDGRRPTRSDANIPEVDRFDLSLTDTRSSRCAPHTAPNPGPQACARCGPTFSAPICSRVTCNFLKPLLSRIV